METPRKPLKAKYELAPNVFAACRMHVLSANLDGFRIQVGIHSPGDTLITPGNRIYLTQYQPHADEESNTLERHYVIVEGVERSPDGLIQVCSSIFRESRPDSRKHERQATKFHINLEEAPSQTYTVTTASMGGLSLTNVEPCLLLGVSINKRYHLSADYKTEKLRCPIKVAHIYYNWQTNRHSLGVQILEISAGEEILLNRLIDPSYKFEVKQKASVDAEAAKIRFDSP